MLRTPPSAVLALLALGACTARAPLAPLPAPAPVAAAPAEDGEAEIGESFALEAVPRGIGLDLLGTVEYDLPVVGNEWVRMELEFLVHQRHAVVGRWMQRAERYRELVREVLGTHGVPGDLVHLAMIESGFQPTVRSRAGAVGIWQFMPATGRGMGLRIDSLVDERMDPVRSTHAAARHLRDLHRRFGGDWPLAAAAYNAGEGRIGRGLGRFGARDFWELARIGDLAQETRHYVPRLYAMTIIGRDPERFGYPPAGEARPFRYDSVRVDVEVPLEVLAAAGGMAADELREMNPHLVRQRAPRGYWVWVPAGSGEALQLAFDASAYRSAGGYRAARPAPPVRTPAPPRPATVRTHTVASGETLWGIARRYATTVDRLRSANSLAASTPLRPGQRLAIPAAE